MLAFPAPNFDYNFYNTGGAKQRPLLNHPDFLVLRTSRDERLPALHVKMPGAIYTILYSHGNAEDLSLVMDDVQYMAETTNANVLAYDYVGYSLSRCEGRAPSETRVYRSIDAAWNFLVKGANIPQNRIVIFGRSIGSGPSVDLASRAHMCPAAVVLQSPLASGARVLFGRIGAIFRFFDIFINCEKIHRIQCKTFIMHGLSHPFLLFSGTYARA
jgi:fermentation-respiration switch protein FrsA (DUF1100 family)